SFSQQLRPPPRPALFPYTTLFRSHRRSGARPPPAPSVSLHLGLASGREARGDPRRQAHDPSSRRCAEHPPEAWERWTLATPTAKDRKSTRLNSSHVSISYAVFCLK